MNEELNKLLNSKSTSDEIQFGMHEYELEGIVKNEKYIKKVLNKKQELLNKHYNGLFQWENKNSEENILEYKIPCIIKNNLEKERIGIYISKIGVIIGICSALKIEVANVMKNTEEDTYQAFREELRKLRTVIKNSNTLKKLNEIGIIDDKIYSQSLKLQPLLANKIADKYVNHIYSNISKILIDSKMMMNIQDLDITDEIGKYIDPEKFALWYSHMTISNFLNIETNYDQSETEKNSNDYKDSIDFAINFYKQIIEKNSDNLKYTKKIILVSKINSNNKKGIYTTNDFISDYTKFYENYLFNNEYIDSDIVKKLTEVPPKEFSLDWEILPEGHMDTTQERKRNKSYNIETIGGLNTSKKDILEAKEKLLHEKKAFFESTCPILKIKGTNKMNGYYGFVYSNGKVVFEKFYNGKHYNIPTINEAIYVMRIDNFKELSKYSKPEIIQFINDTENPNVRRIYHSKNWKENVINTINSKETNKKEIEKLKEAKEALLNSINTMDKNSKVMIKK